MESYLAPPSYADALPALKALRGAGLKTAILSNGSPSMLISATKASDLSDLLDEVISVEEVGIFKPHPSVYRLATEQFDCAPTRIAFISSNGWDAAGAAAFGFQVVWVNRRAAPREHLPAAANAEIGSLAGLAALLLP